ncbi:MAG TPA: GspE/PulE family protein [Patescibacteria group bacterium]|nr:GspE/PulE family protein [Patescibacteria group bacterium]
MNVPTKVFLNLLVVAKAISQQEADRLEIESLQKNIPIDSYTLTNSKAPREEVLKAKAKIFNTAWKNVETIPIAPQVLALVPESIARKYTVIPFELDKKGDAVNVIMENPLDLQVIDFLEKKTGKKIVPFMGLGEDIRKVVDTFYSQGISPDVSAALKEVEPEIKTVSDKTIGNIIKEAPIAKIVFTTLEYAVRGRASDVHIEPQENATRVRYRIDGILHEKLSLPKELHDALISRIKILSGMKIDEKRIPQDGRFNFKTGIEEVDLRVSSLPTANGEKIVMRLLKKTGGIPSLMELGLRGPQLKRLDEGINKPYGIILVTGPTGSGKSTTLYSVLSKLNKPSVNISTIEDPVEYMLPGVNQVQINPAAGLTFATALRSFLRQDPNIILVGEIRDKETTQLAIQAALTGHLVFSTLHTNDAATAIPRLIDLGGEPFLIASVLNVSVAQRICRRICAHCKTSYTASPELVANIKEVLGDLLPKKTSERKEIPLYKGTGCIECNHTGYYGRIGIFEVLTISDTVNKMIIQHTTAKDIEVAGRKEGLIMMKQDGYLKALDGITTIEEVLRVAEI